jgi:cation transport protein ChaC
VLTRENIRDGLFRRMIMDGNYPVPLLSEAEVEASRRGALAGAADGGDVWVFGYGSLMWNPAFHHVERRSGAVHGYHRQFCLWTHLGRGSPDRPGLTLGLERGGSCQGIALRIAAEAVEEETTILWRREMLSGAYVPTWVRVRTEAGIVPAITFTINKSHPRYTGRIADELIVEAIALAAGPVGPCSDYLFNTVAHLEELGLTDHRMRRLRDRVAERCRQARPQP